MNKERKLIINSFLTIGIIVAFFFISLFVEKVLKIHSVVQAIFTLGVFLISLLTKGYIYGIIASLISVLAINYAFRFPYFRFNFTIQENLIAAIIMLIITTVSSALVTKLRLQDKMRAETEKEKMRANLLRAVSHDLRTPLTTIYGSSSAIIDGYDSLNKEQIMQLAKGIKEDSQWLMGMVENLLSVTKINNNGVRLKKKPIVLEELIDAVLIRFKKRYPSWNISIDIPEEFISIPMDAVLIEQVIFNLLQNSVLHAEGATEIGIKVFTVGNNAIFEISDNGCGIPKDMIENIFTGYFEKKNTPVDNQKSGMGIGLSVCASIIKAHKGDISVENRKSGGCCFRFFLSMEEEENEQ